MWITRSFREIHDGTLNDGAGMLHASEAASHDPHEDSSHDLHEDSSHDLHEDGSHDLHEDGSHEDGSHDLHEDGSHEDGSHDLLVEQTSPSSDITANQNVVDIID